MKHEFNWEVIRKGDTWQHFYTIMSKMFNKPSYDHISGLLKLSDTWYISYQSKSHCTMSRITDSEREIETTWIHGKGDVLVTPTECRWYQTVSLRFAWLMNWEWCSVLHFHIGHIILHKITNIMVKISTKHK
jgi:hypothetical protein